MSNRISHIRGKVSLNPASTDNSEIKWKVTDDQGRGWNGVVEPATNDHDKFVVTLKLIRDRK